MKISGVRQVRDAIRKLEKQYGAEPRPSVVVGYASEYALYVHENMEMALEGEPRSSGIGVYWGPHGQSKFLEQPAREHGARMALIIRRAVKKKATMLEALYMAGLYLQRESMELVPVEHGNLRASAFTEKE